MGERWADYIDPTPMIFPKAVQDRWYRNHSRAYEDHWLFRLNSGRVGLIGGRVLVCADKEVLVAFCLTNHYVGQVTRLMLPEGTRVHRLQEAGRNRGGYGSPGGVPRLR